MAGRCRGAPGGRPCIRTSSGVLRLLVENGLLSKRRYLSRLRHFWHWTFEAAPLDGPPRLRYIVMWVLLMRLWWTSDSRRPQFQECPEEQSR